MVIKVNKLFFFFSSRCFLEEIENMFSVLVSRNTRENFEELDRGNTRLRLVFPKQVSSSQTSTRVSVTRQKHGTCFIFLS